MDIFLAHCLGLLWLSVGTARRLVLHPSDRLLAALLLVWGNFSLTRILLALTGRLGDMAWLLAVSLALAALVAWACSHASPAPAPPQAAAPGPRAWLVLTAGLGLLPLDPARFFRIFLEQPGDPEVLDAVGWLLAGFALYRLGRVGRLGAPAALAVGWLGLALGLVANRFGPAMRLLPAAGVLSCLVFAWQWQQGRRRNHALLGGLAAILVGGGLAGQLLPDLRWAGPPSASPATGPLAPDPQRLFYQDLVLAPETGPVLTEGLRPAEGPFPLRGLPRFRGVRQPVMRLRLTAPPEVTRLRLRLSVGLLQRPKTALAVLCNGRPVRQVRLSRPDAWVDEILECDARPGENVIEFADVPHQQELDWRGYLERYPDVTRHLVTHSIPPEQGALEHYELSGRPEGRIMLTREIPPPVAGAYYFVFRQLQVEGRR